ncbi:MAG: CDP-diacylglycerol--serine O-phosphatidyltransferase [Saprospiraceae bacterium]
MKNYIPNFITLLNAFFGCLAIVSIFANEMLLSALWLGLGAVADFMDGAVARLLNAKSALGKQLDSLADMISFGVAPGLILYHFITPVENGLIWKAVPAFILTVAACFRLGKFNIDPRQTTSFIGLPTPACTLFVVGLLLIAEFDSFGLRPIIYQPLFIYACIAVLSYLMVSELPMFGFKFERFTWQGNEIKIIFAALALLLLVFLREAAPAFIILMYLLISLVITFAKKEKNIGTSAH